jgi:tetratricopeptide (TPR) repeat protein
MIVRDEEANLSACLSSVTDLVDEVIVVDTGSADRSREVAAAHGARVFDFPWRDDFAAARNESLRHARGDWTFWLDADDRLDEDNRQKLQRLFAQPGQENVAYMMRQFSLPGAVSGATPVVDQAKLFRNDPRVRWEYRVHEQILPAVLCQGGRARQTDIIFHHTGYQDPAVRRRKLERNLRLLLLQDAERPGDPFTLFNLGATYLDLGRAAEAVPLLQRSLARMPPVASLPARTYGLLTRALRRLGRDQEALTQCSQGRGRFPADADLLFYEAQMRWERGELAAAEACLRQLLQRRPGAIWAGSDVGLYGYKARHQLALLYGRQQRYAEAAHNLAVLRRQKQGTAAG